MIKTIFGNTLLNNTCSKILHGNYNIIKNSVILIMLIISMIIILFEITIKKFSTSTLPFRKQNTSLKPFNKLALK
jgi:hypothetical protein